MVVQVFGSSDLGPMLAVIAPAGVCRSLTKMMQILHVFPNKFSLLLVSPFHHDGLWSNVFDKGR